MNVTYDFFLASPVVSRVSCSSYIYAEFKREINRKSNIIFFFKKKSEFTQHRAASIPFVEGFLWLLCWHRPPSILSQGISMTNIDSHCTKPQDLVNIWPARSPGFVLGDLTMNGIVHIPLPVVCCFVSWRLGRPHRGMPTGPKVLLDFAGRVWAAALRPDPL